MEGAVITGMLVEDAELITNGRWTRRPEGRCLEGDWWHDSRRLRPGDLFVALRGESRDGHDYVAAAHAAGARAALVERICAPEDFPQLLVENSLQALQELGKARREEFGRPVLGITGSFGKTTVREMLGSVMGPRWLRSEENFNNPIGLPLSLWRLDPQRHAGGIFEIGINRGGEMAELAQMLRPQVAVFTAVGPAHLEQLGDLNGVAREKAQMALAVADGGQVVAPLELLEYPDFAALTERLRVTAVAPADRTSEPLARPDFLYHYNWTDDENRPGAGELLLEGPGGPGRFALEAGSPGMLSNAALVVATGRLLGRSDQILEAALREWKPYRQRGERIRCGATEFYVDCYNANPGSMKDSAARFLAYYPECDHLYVLGCMEELGETAGEWHERCGREMPLAPGARVLVTGDWAEAFANGLRGGGTEGVIVEVVADRDALRAEVRGFGEGAVFLKGSRRYQLEQLIPEGGEPC